MTAVLERHAPPARAAREIVAARAAVVVVALAVLDDAFVHREPGTSIADHLASGLLHAAAAVVLAFLYPHLRAGARAVVALVCGSPAIVAGTVEGLRHMLVDRLSGDDLTALLSSPPASS